MDRRRFLVTSLAGAIATPLVAAAQQAQIARVGVLLFGDALGYVEGRNILFERRYAEGEARAASRPGERSRPLEA